MAGNDGRRGAIRKTGTKKGPVVGSGGQRRAALEGKGPTPKATERKGHPAARRAAAAQRHANARAAAAKRRPSRGATGEGDVVFGRNPVAEALRAGVPAEQLLVAVGIDFDQRVREALRTAQERSVPMMEITRPEMDRVAMGGSHQGLVLRIPPYAYSEVDDLLGAAYDAGEQPLLVALDQITDPRNFGAIARSAAAFGAHGLVTTERRAVGVTAAAWKTSAGAFARVGVAQVTNMTRQLQAFKKSGLTIVGLAGDADMTLADAPIAGDGVVIVVGAEGAGLSRLVREECDLVVSIPITSSVESLNASVAAGIALYEVARQR